MEVNSLNFQQKNPQQLEQPLHDNLQLDLEPVSQNQKQVQQIAVTQSQRESPSKKVFLEFNQSTISNEELPENINYFCGGGWQQQQKNFKRSKEDEDFSEITPWIQRNVGLDIPNKQFYQFQLDQQVTHDSKPPKRPQSQSNVRSKTSKGFNRRRLMLNGFDKENQSLESTLGGINTTQSQENSLFKLNLIKNGISNINDLDFAQNSQLPNSIYQSMNFLSKKGTQNQNSNQTPKIQGQIRLIPFSQNITLQQNSTNDSLNSSQQQVITGINQSQHPALSNLINQHTVDGKNHQLANNSHMKYLTNNNKGSQSSQHFMQGALMQQQNIIQQNRQSLGNKTEKIQRRDLNELDNFIQHSSSNSNMLNLRQTQANIQNYHQQQLESQRLNKIDKSLVHLKKLNQSKNRVQFATQNILNSQDQTILKQQPRQKPIISLVQIGQCKNDSSSQSQFKLVQKDQLEHLQKMKQVRDRIEHYKKEFKQEVIEEIQREAMNISKNGISGGYTTTRSTNKIVMPATRSTNKIVMPANIPMNSLGPISRQDNQSSKQMPPHHPNSSINQMSRFLRSRSKDVCLSQVVTTTIPQSTLKDTNHSTRGAMQAGMRRQLQIMKSREYANFHKNFHENQNNNANTGNQIGNENYNSHNQQISSNPRDSSNLRNAHQRESIRNALDQISTYFGKKNQKL
eukprot:403343720